MRKVLIAILIIAALLAGAGYLLRDRISPDFLTRKSPQQKEADLSRVKKLLESDQPKEAMEVINLYGRELGGTDPQSEEWREQFIKASIATRDLSRLLFLYQQNPDSLLQNENASLLVAGIFLARGDLDSFVEVRESWQGREEKPHTWTLLDADKIMLDDGLDSAILYLQQQQFEGEKDVPRLLRLAILHLQSNPNEAWRYLGEAAKKEPKNPLVRLYRSRMLEATNRLALSLNELLTAARLNPDNLALRNQVAEFYRRHGYFGLAEKVWEGVLEKSPNLGSAWVKLWFWNKVAVESTPEDQEQVDFTLPEDSYHSYAKYLSQLPEGTYWDELQFKKLPEYTSLLTTQQSTFWLRLLQALKEQDDDQAWNLLQSNPFARFSWSPDLQDLLTRILAYRRIGTLAWDQPALEQNPAFDEEGIPEATLQAEAGKEQPKMPRKHILVQKVQQLVRQKASDKAGDIPPDMEALLKGPDAFSFALLSSGWLNAALDLLQTRVFPDNYPDWVAYDVTHMIRRLQGPQKALAFALQQKETDPLSLLIGELLVANGSPDAGLERLQSLANNDSTVGLRAAWLVSLLLADQKQTEDAKQVIYAHPTLKESVTGQETLARIALLEGNEAEADQIYSALEPRSFEAKSYLARQAFDRGDYERSKGLTEELIRRFPNSVLLRQNYIQIMQKLGLATVPPAPNAPPEEEQEAEIIGVTEQTGN